ncbi:MAG: hypothetical protein FJ222_08860 [Lentisphaerae bacterium]|nr:hypothetical protein [Lentisphaerota bacterium]
MRETKPIFDILVAGDAGSDFDIYLHSGADNPPPGTRTTMRHSLGGAGLVQRMLAAWVKENMAFVPVAEKALAVAKQELSESELKAKIEINQLEKAPQVSLIKTAHISSNLVAPPTFGVWRPCPLGERFADKGDKTKIWRVGRSIGSGVCDASFVFPKPEGPAPIPDGYNPGVLVLVDHANCYRHPHGETLPHEPFWMRPDATVVWKMAPPFCRGELWWRGVCAGVPARSVVLLSLSRLRTEAVRVSCRVSWERTALEIARELEFNPTLADLRSCRDVVVTIHGEGAVWRSRTTDASNDATYRLIFDPVHMEGEWAQEHHIDGDVYGSACAMSAALAAQLALGQDRIMAIAAAIPRGLLAMRLLHVLGHGPVDATENNTEPGIPSARMARVLRNDPSAFDGLKRDVFGNFGDVEIPAQRIREPDSCWRIAACGSQGSPLHGLARRFALTGKRELRAIPHACFGELLTADRSEIEALRNFKTLIRTYKAGKDTKPLSLAVFGPPGAGKSFGIEQIAGQVLGDEGKICKFNLSQFDEADLAGALHQVRDEVLRGKLPVVFWDEFDSDQYKWLKLLLAPMNDGVFQEGQITHPLGRCIFVFAGGTSDDAEHFGPKPPTEGTLTPEQTADWNNFKLAKGPDFMSRLHGTLNILGPNQQIKRDWNGGQDPNPDDVSYPLRRALLLRAKLKLKPDQRLEMDPGLLSALLETPRYTNGSRSFEKIVLAIRGNAAGRTRYLPSDLPSDAVLAMNVDDIRDSKGKIRQKGAAAFKAILTHDAEFQCLAEKLAPAIHLSYIPLAERENPNNTPYPNLPPEQKADNTAAAMRIPWLLGLAGLQIVQTPDSGDILTDEQVLEILSEPNTLEMLAEEEHDMWVMLKKANGWILGERKDAIHSHNLLIPYAELKEPQKKKDRNNVQKIPEQVSLAGFSIIRKKGPMYHVSEK